MSRSAKQPITLPKGVELQRSGQNISLKGSKGNLSFALNSEVDIEDDNGTLTVKARSGSRFARAMAGTVLTST